MPSCSPARFWPEALTGRTVDDLRWLLGYRAHHRLGCAPLTPRQYDVALLTACGATEGEIARALGIRVTTAHRHQYDIYLRLGVHSKTELLRVLLGMTPRRSLS